MLVDMNTVPQCMVVSSALSSVRLPISLSSVRLPMRCTPTAERLSVGARGYLRRVMGNVRQQSKSANLKPPFSEEQRDRHSISGRITGAILY